MRCDRGATPRRATNTAGYSLDERRKCMSVKVKVSYTDDQELAGVIRLLAPAVQRCKVPRLQEGRYKRAYIELQVEEKQRTPDEA